MSDLKQLLSLVVPVYYEEACIEEFIKQTTAELTKHNLNYEIVFVDDGSKDSTVEKIKSQIILNPRIKLVELSYNHGKEAAVSAGITYAKGNLLLYMDPDLQDPPTSIINFINKINEGYDLVFGVREEKVDVFFNVIFSKLFWWSLRRFTELDIPDSLAVMRIFNRKFANEFLKYGEANRFIEGIFCNISMRRTQIVIPQQKRFAGNSKFTFKKKLNLALKAIFDFSDLPLKLATRFGLLLVLLGFISVVAIVILKFFFISFHLGWPSLMATLITGFGCQIFFLGIIGKYIGNIYKETKRRPLFSVKEVSNF